MPMGPKVGWLLACKVRWLFRVEKPFHWQGKSYRETYAKKVMWFGARDVWKWGVLQGLVSGHFGEGLVQLVRDGLELLLLVDQLI